MKVIGLAGRIGTGKSTVARFLAELGAAVLDADKIGHEAFKPGTGLWRQVVNEFGKDIVAPDGNIDREKLGKLVFNNPDARLRLNQIMHPAMYDMAKALLDGCRKQGKAVAVLEAPLLFEAGWTSLVDEVWVTVASEATIIKRLGERSGLSEEKSRARLRNQLSGEEQAQRADVVIDTDCSLEEVETKIHKLWAGITKDRNRRLKI